METLEAREVSATLLGLNTAGTLVTFDSGDPGTLVGTPVAVTGLQAGETLVGIDYRPANNTLYGVGSTSRLYTLDPTTGAATAVGGPFATPRSGSSFGVDFNPVADRLRVVGNDGQSLRVVPSSGAATADTPPAFDPDDAQNQGYYGTTGEAISPAPAPSAAAYTLNLDSATHANVTTLYAIDPTQDVLFRVGGPDGDPSPNGGLSAVVDQIRDAATFALVDFGTDAAFDIEANSDAAFAVSGTSLYSLNLTTAAATALGGVSGTGRVGLAVVPPAAGAGTRQLSATTLAFDADRTPLAVTLTRTGGASQAVTVGYATSDGTAVGGTDYLPASATVSFAAGVTTRTFFLSLPAGTPTPGPEKAFTLTLSNPTGGLTLGANTAATVTVPAVATPPSPPAVNPPANPAPNPNPTAPTTPPTATPAPTPTRLFAVGAGTGGSGGCTTPTAGRWCRRSPRSRGGSSGRPSSPPGTGTTT